MEKKNTADVPCVRRFGDLLSYHWQTHNFAPSPHSEFAFCELMNWEEPTSELRYFFSRNSYYNLEVGNRNSPLVLFGRDNVETLL